MTEENQDIETIETKSSLKKKILYVSFFIDFIIILGVVYFYFIFPRTELQSLEKGHIQVSVQKTQGDKGAVEYEVEYSFVDKKPKDWVSLKDINYTAAHAIVVSEDWAFYQHSGYDYNQIKEAVGEALDGERKRGASTISQQVVKNIFLTKDKTLSRKSQELLYSLYMERNVSKEKILETYLNVVEFGPGVYGIKAASKHYFNKEPKNLTPKEGAFLAMLLPSPKRYDESFERGEMTEFAQKTVDDILEKMVVAKYLKKEQLNYVKEQSFSWEKNKQVSLTKDVVEEREEKSEDQPQRKRSFSKKQARPGKRKDLSGKKTEASYGIDDELHLEENPEFDEDAIMEDTGDAETEFSVQ